MLSLRDGDKSDGRTVYSHEVLYEHISDPEDALLLAQLAMCEKYSNELIFIFPGANYSIKTYHEELYKKALELAKKCKED